MSDAEARLPGSLQLPPGAGFEVASNFLKKHGVKFILAQFVDIHGGLKSKSVPVERLGALLEEGAGFAGAAIIGYGMKPQDQEYMMLGDLQTLSLLPWAPGYARIMGTGKVLNKPHAADPRNVLQTQMARLAERGWVFNTGLEPEFMLLKRNPDGSIATFDDTDDAPKPTYDYRGLLRNRGFLERLVDTLQTLGLKVYQIDHEDAHGQYEVNFEFANALKTCDNIQLFKLAATEIAHEMGAICSFIPKLNATSTGNGMHVHCSIADESGRNLFFDESDPSGMALSKLAYQFTAGILAHAKGLTALLAPSVNSYKRLVLGRPDAPSWAPVYIAYGDNNRSCMVRIPYGRIEMRTGDGCMNPYLATAAIIAAGLDGIDRELQAEHLHNVNFFDLPAATIKELGVDTLPSNLDQAIDALESDALLVEKLGAGLIESFVAIKRQEWRDYHQAVSDWELQRYLTFI